MSVADRPQHMDALDKANRVRLARSEVRRRVRAGELTVADALDHWAVQTAPLFEVLQWRRGWRAGRARKFMRRLGGELAWPVGELREVRSLTERQRAAAVALLGLADEDDS